MSTSRSSRRSAAPFAAASLALIMLMAAVSCSKGDEKPNGASGTQPVAGAATKLTKDDEAGPPVSGGSLTFGLAAETDGWSPFFNRFAGSGYIVGNAIYDPLFTYDVNGKPAPYLAESGAPTPGSDFKEWKITLRPGITFHNGEKLDAAVVKANFEAGRTSPLVGAAFEPITNVEGNAGSLEVKVTMKSPWSTFLHTLTSQLGYVQAPILANNPKSDDAVRKPIGTGPFKFESWVPDQSLRVKRNDGYWRKEHPVYLESIDFKVLSDFQTRGQSLEGGTIDVMETGDPDQLAKFREKAELGEFQIYTDEGLDSQETFIALNTAKPPFNDLTARQIIAYGIDTNALSQSSYRGEFPGANGPFSKESPYYTETEYPKYDVEKAKVLLEEYKAKNNGQTLRFSAIVPPAPEYLAIATNLKQQAVEYGVEVDIKSEDQTRLIVDVLTGNYEASGFILFGSPSIDREYVFIASQPNPIGETSLNFTRLNDPILVEAMNKARATDDEAEQIKQHKVVQQQMAKNLNFIYLVHNRGAIVYGMTAHGFSKATLPDGKPALTSVSPFTYQVWVKR